MAGLLRSYPAQTLVVVSAATYIALTPLIPESVTLPQYDAKRIVQIILLVATAGSIMVLSGLRSDVVTAWRRLSGLTRYGLLVVLAIGIVSSALSNDPAHAFLEVSHLTLLGALCITVASLAKDRPQECCRLVVWLLFFGALIYTVLFLRDYLYSQLDLTYSFRRGQVDGLWPDGEFLGYTHRRIFNHVQTLAIPFLALPALWAQRKPNSTSLIMLLVASSWWVMVFASGARGTLVSSLIAFFLTFFLLRRAALRYYGYNALAFVVGLAAFYVLFIVMGETLASSLDQRNLATTSGRIGFWKHAYELFNTSPVFGIGPMHYARFHPLWAASPHSSLIQILTEWGLMAAVLVVAVSVRGVVQLGRQLIYSLSDIPEYLDAALLTSVLAALGHSMLTGLLVSPPGQTALALVLGLAVGVTLNAKGDYQGSTRRQSETSKRQATAIAVLLSIVVVTECSLSLKSFQGREERRLSATSQNIDHRRLPRFWNWGCIMDYSEANVDSSVR